MELVCSVQKYEWGKKGEASAVAQLAKENRNEPVEKETPYAELWMGVHPNGPSVVKHGNLSLNQVIEADPNLLGTAVVSSFGAQLPYLFKVLSVGKALSIQAHPSKSHAEELFKKFPTVYKDPNHKPEIAIALTDFEALCGFRPRQEISEALKNVAALRGILSDELVSDFVDGGASIRPCFEALMKADPLKVKKVIDDYLLTNDSSVEKKLIKRLNAEYPGDVGVLCVFWLNYVVLKPGEALFLAPNEPHAYIHGDCVECMSSSDNVVRAGLTPKFRDVDTLCSMLTYKSYHPSEIKFQPVKEDTNTVVFRPPVQDFAVACTKISRGESYVLKGRSSASIVIAINGVSTSKGKDGKEVKVGPGVVLFLPADETLSVTAESDQTLYQAFCNL